MNDNYKASKIQKFIEDEGMTNVIFEAIEDTFKEAGEHNKNIQFLAANMLSIVLLKKARSKLESNRGLKTDEKPQLKQVGL